ncbi:MAG: serine hydroxymethyltransferase [Candidatus Marinimicrobia bacterium]|nr:serine hydroxymethyltransferase [Candidatus Neomarinimicrobiota bacterium]
MFSNNLQNLDPQVFSTLNNELYRQIDTLELIASENFVSESVLEVTGGVMTNKYAEGYPGKRYYGGCEWVDEAENIARDRAKSLFLADYVNVQPHSGSQANMAVFFTFLKPGDTIMGLDLAHGGHLTHGSAVNFSGKLFNIISYQVERDTGRVDFNKISDLAIKKKPKLIICGGSALPRFIEFESYRTIADKVGAFLLADIAHPSGLVASGIHPTPWPHCHIVTSTTHKTLRGPRGGLILMGEDFENPWGVTAPKTGRTKNLSELIDSNLMPGIQGGPLMHIIAAKAVAFGEALKPEFKTYCEQVVLNAKTMADLFIQKDYNLISHGTDTHVLLIDLTNKGISGKKAENILEIAGIAVNKNMVPYDERSPMITSGIRIGTPAITTRGMGKEEMYNIVENIDRVIQSPDDKSIASSVREEIKEMCKRFPVYPGLVDEKDN